MANCYLIAGLVFLAYLAARAYLGSPPAGPVRPDDEPGLADVTADRPQGVSIAG